MAKTSAISAISYSGTPCIRTGRYEYARMMACLSCSRQSSFCHTTLNSLTDYYYVRHVGLLYRTSASFLKEATVKTSESGTGSLARRVATRLNKIGIAIRSRAWKAVAVQRITPLQAQTLAIFGASKKHGMTISAIAEEWAVSLPTASEAVTTLEKKGWVQRKRSSADGRVVTVRLTAKGKRKREKAAGPPIFSRQSLSGSRVPSKRRCCGY